MNTRARVAAWLLDYDFGYGDYASYEEAADELIAVVFADGGDA